MNYPHLLPVNVSDRKEKRRKEEKIQAFVEFLSFLPDFRQGFDP